MLIMSDSEGVAGWASSSSSSHPSSLLSAVAFILHFSKHVLYNKMRNCTKSICLREKP
jgi:hypothetical protein